MSLIEWVERALGYRRVTLTETERAIVTRDGRVHAVLAAGRHLLGPRDQIETLSLLKPAVPAGAAESLKRGRPDLAAQHLTEVATAAGEVAVLFRDGRPHTVVAPETVAAVLAEAGPWTVERFDAAAAQPLDGVLAERLVRAGLPAWTIAVEVPEAHVAVVTVDGRMAAPLGPGAYRFWAVGPKVAAKVIDTRWRSHDVTGQEILTKDRVTLRVNLAADYRVTDPVKAVTAVRDFEEALHRALQLAFRRTLGALTLDALLADKVAVDADAAAAVRSQMAGLGLEVGAIALKDVVLPGDMREILARVVAAEKEAEANVIRRREETNATRSLLNTAKVMAENPVMLRLKELEALEAIAGKVGQLTVLSGTEGLMTQLVRLREG